MSSQLRNFMRAQVADWRHSGMSMEAYAQKLGVTRYKFEYWVRKFKSETSTGAGHQFIQLKPIDIPVPVDGQTSPPVQIPQPQMELTFTGGTCLKIYL